MFNKFKLLSFFLIIFACFTLTACVKKGVDNEGKINLPTTKEETIELISKVSGVVYEIQDEDIDEYAPSGTVFALVAGTFSEGLCGIYFDTVENRDAGFEESKKLIENSMDIEFDATAGEVEVKKNGNWVYGGTKKFVEYFEGKVTADSLTPKLPSTVKETEEFFKANGYMTGSFELPKDSDEPNEKGIVGYVQAGKDKDTKSVFLCFLVDTEENANKYREDLIDTLEEAFEEEIIDDLGWEINSYSFGVVGNFVYLGTKDAINLFIGK